MNLILVLAAVFALGSAQVIPAPVIPILRKAENRDNFGQYSLSFETGNGIRHQESLRLKQIGKEQVPEKKGTISYTSPEGIPISLSYIADEYGFRPAGAHLPGSQPIPPQIAASLALTRAAPVALRGLPLGNPAFG